MDLMEADSPRARSFPKKFNLNQESPRKELGAENRDPDFRTPNLCSRPSFRDKFSLALCETPAEMLLRRCVA